MAKHWLLCLVLLLTHLFIVHSQDAGRLFSQCLSRNENSTLGLTCQRLQGLQFCSMMNGLYTDLNYNEAKVIDGASPARYYAAVDTYLSNAYSIIENRVTQIQLSRNGQVCSSCLANIKELLCAGAFPRCGFRKCTILSPLGRLATDCGNTICPCPSSECCFFGPNGELPGNVPAQDENVCPLDNLAEGLGAKVPKLACLYFIFQIRILFICFFAVCLLPDMAQINRDLADCKRFKVSSKMCYKTMQTCGCASETSVADMCDSIFPKNGEYTIRMTAGDCKQVSEWCPGQQDTINQNEQKELVGMFASALSGIKAISQTTTGPVMGVCPNSDLCIRIPTPVVNEYKISINLLDYVQKPAEFANVVKRLATFALPPLPSYLDPTFTASEYAKRLVCDGKTDPNCQGCTDISAANFDKFATFYQEGVCQPDVVTQFFLTMEWLFKFWWVIVIGIAAGFSIFCVAYCSFCVLSCCICIQIRKWRRKRGLKNVEIPEGFFAKLKAKLDCSGGCGGCGGCSGCGDFSCGCPCFK